MRTFIIGFLLSVALAMSIYTLFTQNLNTDEFQRLSIEKIVNQMTTDLERAMPLINEAGYTMSSVSIKTSLPPLVIASFKLENKVPFAKQDKILQSLEDNIIGKLALESLIQSFKLDETIEIKNMDLKTIRLWLSIPPAVQVEYN